ncbi:N-6 DNA methylase [Micromonospora sp. BQ11]|uniref:N-6 DNA methylase n=1 Tax=Micromonospora sp. BQ11 TaxID=3452212 RepID=UPI003F8AE56E
MMDIETNVLPGVAMIDEAGSDDRLVTRSEIAELAGVSRENVTNWARRHSDFPKPVRSGDAEYFRLAEVMSWWERRTIPDRSLREGESAGITYADRVRRTGTAKGQSTRENPPATQTPNRDEHERLLVDGLLSTVEGRIPGTGNSAGYLHLLTSLAFLRASAPEDWEHLRRLSRQSGGPNEGRTLLVQLGVMADRRLRERGLLPGVRFGLGGLQPSSPDDLSPVIQASAQLGPAAFRALMDRYAARARLGPETSFTPNCVARLMANLLLAGRTSGGRVLDPYARGGELLAAMADRYQADAHLEVYGQSADQDSLRLAGMNLAVRGLQARLQHCTPASWVTVAWPRQKVDLILTNPPFNTGLLSKQRRGEDWPFGPPPEGNDNFAWIQHILASLDSGGRAVVVMPNTAGTSANARERAIRKVLIDKGAVECVIALPRQLFPTTAIPVSVWLLTAPAEPRDQVLFINAQKLGTASKGQRTLSSIDQDTILAAYRSFLNDREQGRHHLGTEQISLAVDTNRLHGPTYSLNPLEHRMASARTRSPGATMTHARDALRDLSRQQAQASAAEADTRPLLDLLSETGLDEDRLPDGWRRVHLRDICDIHAGPSHSRLGTPKVQAGTSVVLPKHLRHGRIDATGEERIPPQAADRLQKDFRLQAGDIVSVRSGSTGPSALVSHEQNGWLFSTNLLRLRRTQPDDVDPRYLLSYLNLPRVQEWIRGRSAATAIASISVEDFGLLEVILPPLPRQERVGAALSALDEQILAAQRVVSATALARTLLSEQLMDIAAELSPLSTVTTAGQPQKGQPA